MEYISSDSNIWMDFNCIGKLNLTFKLSYTYLMWEETIDKELSFPDKFKNDVMDLGLEKAKINDAEYNFAYKVNTKYKCLTFYDCVALSIAKEREIVLLTGDGNLRKIASNYNIEVKGTLGILDELLYKQYISIDVYKQCLLDLKFKTEAGLRRLPLSLIDDKLKKGF